MRPESIHHKVQWSSEARGAHGGMISEPLWVRKTGSKKKKNELASFFSQRRGGFFCFFFHCAPYLLSPPPAGPLQPSAAARFRLLNTDFHANVWNGRRYQDKKPSGERAPRKTAHWLLCFAWRSTFFRLLGAESENFGTVRRPLRELLLLLTKNRCL